MTVRRINANQYLQEKTQRPHTTVDLRTPVEVNNQCLEGCVLLPVQELDPQHFDKMLKESGHKEGPVYLLCQSGKRADMAVAKLAGQTEHELVIIEGGVNALVAGGVSVKQGTKVMSLERQVRIAAGAFGFTGSLLGLLVSPWFFAIPLFVGAGLMFAGITDTCAMGMLLARMPWNRV